jgi:hypothetical protein
MGGQETRKTVARKLRMIEEWRPDQSCLFRKGDYRNKGYNPENVLGLITRKSISCSSKTMPDRRMAPIKKQSNPKTALGPTL